MSINWVNLSSADKFAIAMATNQPQADLLQFIESSNFQLDELVKVSPFENHTPLGIAAYFGNVECVNSLLIKGAALSVEGAKSAIEVAAINGNFDVVSAILEFSSSRKEDLNQLCSLIPDVDKDKVKVNNQINELLLIEELKKKFKVNIGQMKIIRKFRSWLLLQKQKYPEKYKDLDTYLNQDFSSIGYCNGLTWLFLYKMSQGFIEKTDNNIRVLLNDLENISEKDIDSGAADQSFEELFREITILHQPYMYLSQHHQDEFMKGIGKYQVNNEFSFAGLLTEAEIEKFITIAVTEGQMNRISNSEHIIGLMKYPKKTGDDDKYVIYDSNQPQGPMYFSTPKECAAFIKSAIGHASSSKVEFMVKQHTLSIEKSVENIKVQNEKTDRLIKEIYQPKMDEYRQKKESFERDSKIYKENLEKYKKQQAVIQEKSSERTFSARGRRERERERRERERERRKRKEKGQTAEIESTQEDIILSEPVKPIEPINPINEASAKGNRLLDLSVRNGNLLLVKWCIENGAIPEDPTILFVAAEKGYADIVDLLLNLGMRGDGLYKDATLIGVAARLGHKNVVEKIITHLKGKNTSELSDILGVALKDACYYTNMEMIDFLLAQGADINYLQLANDRLTNPLIASIIRNNIDNTRRLLCYSHKNLSDYQQRIKKHQSDDLTLTMKVDNALLTYPLEKSLNIQSDDVNLDPLYLAAKYDRQSIAKELIQAGADVNHSMKLAMKDNNRNAALNLIKLGARLSSTPGADLHDAVLLGNYDKVNELLNHNAQITTARDPSMIKMACMIEDEEMVLILLKDLINKKIPLETDELNTLNDFASATGLKLAKFLVENNMTTVYKLLTRQNNRTTMEHITLLCGLEPTQVFQEAISNNNRSLAIHILNNFSREIDTDAALKTYENYKYDFELDKIKKELDAVVEMRTTGKLPTSQLYRISIPKRGMYSVVKQKEKELSKDEDEIFIERIRAIIQDVDVPVEELWERLKTLNKELFELNKKQSLSGKMQEVAQFIHIYTFKMPSKEKHENKDIREKYILDCIHLIENAINKPKPSFQV